MTGERVATAERWWISSRKLAAFLAEHGQYPVPSHSEEGARLYGWISSQRAEYRRGNLLTERRAWLDENAPNWRGEEDTDDAWRAELERAPKLWLKRQQHYAEWGDLADWKIALLDEKVPDWNPRGEWFANAELALDVLHGGDDHLDDHRVIIWQRATRASARAGALPPKCIAWLEEHFGDGWRRRLTLLLRGE